LFTVADNTIYASTRNEEIRRLLTKSAITVNRSPSIFNVRQSYCARYSYMAGHLSVRPSRWYCVETAQPIVKRWWLWLWWWWLLLLLWHYIFMSLVNFSHWHK